jgi:hypothetical protein
VRSAPRTWHKDCPARLAPALAKRESASLAIVGYLLISLGSSPQGRGVQAQARAVEAPKPTRATFTVVKTEPPAVLTRIVTGLIAKASKKLSQPMIATRPAYCEHMGVPHHPARRQGLNAQ